MRQYAPEEYAKRYGGLQHAGKMRLESVSESTHRGNIRGKMTIHESVDVIDRKSLEHSVIKLNSLDDLYGVMKDTDVTLVSIDSDSGAMAFVEVERTNYLIQRLSLCPSAFSDRSAMLKEVIEGRRTNRFMPFLGMNADSYIATHEYGHLFLNRLIAEEMKRRKWCSTNPDYFVKNATNDMNRYKWYDDIAREVVANCFNEIIDIARTNNPGLIVDEVLSEYGKSDYEEFFAEVFANAHCGKPNELGRALIKWLEDKGYR